ncbi:glutathione S-transferase family protein [Aliamphritea spongicola]|uniref:glutathione S-transferase family protein n=1 Tax=Aliamphritea spongicola TaxID=707589 RepID=UPI00196A37C4|nr:glutathione S-transferase family protein [Aliamphritea spongicola]MBN3563607.1 glutathione S-transferase family protein [Aliamphritea spongicola]
MKIYGDAQSGNCYKALLTAALLELEYEWVAVDILQGQTHTPEFLKKNPNGKIPLLELDDGRYLSESNAILSYLTEGTALWREDRFARGRIMQWMFFEQYSHEPYIAVARFIARYLGLPESRRAEYEAKQAGGHRALQVMEQQLQESPFLVDHQLSAADIALYAYTHVADEGGFDLSGYPAIQAWIGRIQTQQNYLSMA